jgi:hypothetical protein
MKGVGHDIPEGFVDIAAEEREALRAARLG